MMQSLLEGISMGLLLSVMVGPVFFTLITGSMEHGFRYALVLAFGIFISDSLYALLTYYGVSFLANTSMFEEILGWAGGGILIGFGVSSLLKKQASDTVSESRELPLAKKCLSKRVQYQWY
jgi:threonine/homoserine/homoserine lactone efflux protein